MSEVIMMRCTEDGEKLKPTLVGSSPCMKALQEKIAKISRSQAPVYIHGESGTGKELVARSIHYQGSRRNKPFIPVNCGAIPAELMESEFFGHKKGSFTGAVADKQGLFQAAEGGTLFLDEVADLPLLMQVKLLRALQEKAVRPIGEQEEIAIDVRIISASNESLHDLVALGRFRQDLFYRINVIEVIVPRLVERKEDIAVLSAYILERLVSASVSPEMKGIVLSDDALAVLQNYDFPGNVRELENILERAIALSDTSIIQASDLQLPTVLPKTNTLSASNLNGFLDDQEREIIAMALARHHGNRTATAKSLGITFRALRYRLKKLEIE